MGNHIYYLESILDSFNKEVKVFLNNNHLAIIKDGNNNSYNFD